MTSIAADGGSCKPSNTGRRLLSTDDVAEKDRLDYWQYVVGELIGGFELRDCSSEEFRSGFELFTIGDVKIGRFTGVSQTLERTADRIRPSDTDDFIAVLESDNTFNFEQNGRQRSASGGLVLLDVSQPYKGSHPQELDVIDVFIPRHLLERELGPARLAAGLSIDASLPSFPVIAAYLRSLVAHGPDLDPVSAARMSTIAVALIASGFAEKMGQAPRNSGGATMLCRAQAYISEHLGVAGLGMREVAATLGISIRRLHQIAADEGISLVEWMWERRLLRARSLLIDQAMRSRSVAAVAYECGFVDQAHFSRRFKSRFGQAPSDAKAAAQEDACAGSHPPPSFEPGHLPSRRSPERVA